MATLSAAELDEVFVDVRKAYRLIYLYQRRILDTVEYISSILSEPNVQGWSLFSDSFKNGKAVDFESWAWDWIPMYCYEFSFGNRQVNNNNYNFAVAIYADNGYENAREGVKATNVEQFVAVEQAETQLYFYVGKNMWKPENFDAVWSDQYPREFEVTGDQSQFLSLRFPLSRFKDEDGIIEALREFKAYCHSKGMTDFMVQQL